MPNMPFNVQQIRFLKKHRTPFYYYDTELLQRSLQTIVASTQKYGYRQHYAVKANANPVILRQIAQAGLGADCVSGGEIQAALKAGFPASDIVFAGVGKADWEIKLALKNHIFCFNVESEAELKVIESWARKMHTTASVALRVNPNVDAHTHAKITTGLSENKFGITPALVPTLYQHIQQSQHLQWIGVHFHIGSQITDLCVFEQLCQRVNQLQEQWEADGLQLPNINLGGGLGINYQQPDKQPMAEFERYFDTIHQQIAQRSNQTLHFELGRAVVAPCGSLITKVLYIKQGEAKQFAVLDAGMTDLIRPALYDAYHQADSLSGAQDTQVYDLVGPICESSDVFGKKRRLATLKRGDLVALRSAGAYGEVMASRYNLRALPRAVFSKTNE